MGPNWGLRYVTFLGRLPLAGKLLQSLIPAFSNSLLTPWAESICAWPCLYRPVRPGLRPFRSLASASQEHGAMAPTR